MFIMSKQPSEKDGKLSRRDFLKIVVAAAGRGDLEAVCELVDEKPNWIHTVGSHGRTMLWEASYRGEKRCRPISGRTRCRCAHLWLSLYATSRRNYEFSEDPSSLFWISWSHGCNQNVS